MKDTVSYNEKNQMNTLQALMMDLSWTHIKWHIPKVFKHGITHTESNFEWYLVWEKFLKWNFNKILIIMIIGLNKKFNFE
jgi:hypothetical protein